nr:hypothetical protein CKG001_21450 [Bdellovibrio sp. CKG001]BFD63444.1 hypothetical protein BdHM001_21250 [Bdellovibrio sp. HM001]
MGNFKYHLFNPRELNSETAMLSNKIYEAWCAVYSEVLGAVNEPLNADDFHRNDIIVCITDGDKDDRIVGFHLYSVFDLRSKAHLDHHYMKAFDEVTLSRFRQRGITTLMSMEYLTVLPEYRSRNTDVNWSEIIIALGSRVMDVSPGWDAVIGTGRKDLHVRRKAAHSGLEYFGDVMKMNYVCEILLAQKGRITRFEDPKTAALVDSLWAEKNCHIPFLNQETKYNKKAA